MTRPLQRLHCCGGKGRQGGREKEVRTLQACCPQCHSQCQHHLRDALLPLLPPLSAQSYLVCVRRLWLLCWWGQQGLWQHCL